jgi:prepilin-type N-terminal cleavage/methylation domain-containing protein
MPTSSVGTINSVANSVAGYATPKSGVSGLCSLPPNCGVTLLEMMVVLAIIGLIVAISVPSATAGLDSVRLASASQSVAAFLNGAVNRSNRRQQPIEMVISAKENRLALYSNEPGFTRELKLPDGVAIEAVVPETAVDLILMPGASVPGVGIQLVSRHGSHKIVRLDPMTGYPRVEGVTNK